MPKAKPKSITTRTNNVTRLAALSTQDCPVREIMHQAAAVQKTRRRLEEADRQDNERCQQLWDVKTTLTDMASLTRAQSFEGAYFELALAPETLRVDLFENLTPELQKRVLSHEQKAARLIASAAGVTRQAIGEEAARTAARDMADRRRARGG